MSALAYAFILIGGIERFIVLAGVEAMAEQLKLDNDLRCRLEETEAYAHLLRTETSINLSTGRDVGFSSRERIGQGELENVGLL